MFQKMFRLSLMGVCCALWAGESVLVPVNIRIQKDGISVAPVGKTLLNDVFWKDSHLWKFENYKGRISISCGKYGKYKGLVLTNTNTVKNDTAWGIASHPLTLDSGKDEFSLTVDVASDVPLDRSFSNQPMYRTMLTWFGGDGKILKNQDFTIYASPDRPFLNLITGKIPDGAEKAEIRIGADNPNLEPGQYIVFRRIVFQQYSSRNPVYPKEAGFISTPISLRDKRFSRKAGFSWTGKLPGKSQFGIRFSWAPDADGIPGAWSPFLGPDGKAGAFFTAPGQFPKIPAKAAWMRYQFILQSDPRCKEHPVLTSVTLGGIRESGWTGAEDFLPPEIIRFSPSPEEDGKKPVVLELKDDMPIRWDTLKITVDEGKTAVRTKRDGNLVVLTPESAFSAGLHCCRVSVSDSEGNSTKKDIWFYIGRSPVMNRVTLRDDGILLVDGVPFFPIGLYAVCKREFNQKNFDIAFQGLKKGGFNTAHTYGSRRDNNFQEFLGAARKYGFKVFIAGPAGANSKDLRRLLNAIGTERMEPTLLSWYLADDTYRHNTPAQLESLNDAVKAVDPWHPTSQAEHARGGKPLRSWYAGYVNGTDIFLPEVYPMKAKTEEDYRHAVPIALSDMKSIADEVRRSGAIGKGCWPIIQYFEGWNYNRFPSHDEMRAMVWLSVIHGATGITWYTYGGTYNPRTKKTNYGVTSTPERWKSVCQVATELKEMTPWLVARKGPQPPPPRILAGPEKDEEGNTSISSLLKQADGRNCLITASSSWQPLKIAFPLQGFTKAEVLFENRTVMLKDGVLTDEFKPYAAHIYRLY